MAFTDATVDNGWIPVQTVNDPLLRDVEVSAVEAVANKFNMVTDQAKVPSFVANGIDVVAEGATVPLKDATLDKVILDAVKFADRFAQSSEDREDQIVDAFAAYRREWLSNFGIALDNAALGATGSPFGTSVYDAVGTGNRGSLTAALTYENLTDIFGDMENRRQGELVVIAHPSFKMELRNLKDAAGDRVVALDGVLGEAVPSLFGHPVYFSWGAKRSTVFSDQPDGNPLFVVANRKHLILGVRTGPEYKVSDQAQWENDNIEMKMRARRAFVVASADAARVFEKTA